MRKERDSMSVELLNVEKMLVNRDSSSSYVNNLIGNIIIDKIGEVSI